MPDFERIPHPWSALRKELHNADAQGAKTFNDRLGAFITRRLGSMAAVYAVIAITVTWMVLGALGVIPDKAPSYSILLFCSNFVQLALMFVILTGQGVMSRMSDKRAEDTYQDAESLLHEAEQVQAHLAVQDQDLKQLLTHAQALVVHLEGMTAPE